MPIRAFAGAGTLTRAQMLRAPLRWPRPSRLREPLKLAGKLGRGLQALGLRTMGELLEHLPREHRQTCAIAQLRPGEQVTVAVQVRSIASRAVRRRGMRGLVEATVFDQTGSIRAVFFNQPWLVQRYPPATRLVLHGKLDGGGRRFRVAYHAIGSELGASAGTGEAEVVGHYPAAEGVTSTQIMTLVRANRRALADVVEPLAARMRAGEGLADRAAALAAIHFPGDPGEARAARRRLAFEELLLTQLALLIRRGQRAKLRGATALSDPPTLSARWLGRELPFQPTGEQRAAMRAIARDLAQRTPMQRLLMGEVGAGKTVVALYAMLRAVEHDCQAALMAPTETLAEQHFATLQSLLGAESVRCELLTGSTPARRRETILSRLASGELSLIVGTHALIEANVRFGRLAVAVVDEQHRFGVRQREALENRDRAHPPHMLHMTATPIPRTLQLTRYGDLDRIVLRELPRGRQAIATRIVAGEPSRARAYEHLREQLRAGRQAYVVCPLVDQGLDGSAASERAGQDPAGPAASERAGQDPGGSAERGRAGQGALRSSHEHGGQAGVGGAQELRAAKAEFERLRAGELAGWRLALLHGQMRPREKQQAMEQFACGQAHVLVATTVIEVGVDVPNATVMLVENAERFGISQLHQLRGRVGRGEHRSTCLLVGSTRSARLRALAEHADGFRLAEIDLRMRREGELIGTRQSGVEQFKLASLPEDEPLLERARAIAQAILAEDPHLSMPEHALLADALEAAFGDRALQPIAA